MFLMNSISENVKIRNISKLKLENDSNILKRKDQALQVIFYHFYDT